MATTERALETKQDASLVPFGAEMKKHFLFDEKWRNINHGSFGTIPRSVQTKLRALQDQGEARPDVYIRYTYPAMNDVSRSAVASLLNVPVETVVFVPNATTGVNTALRNLQWNEDAKDEVLYFSTIYAACAKSIEYVAESTYGRVKGFQIELTYPAEDDEVVATLKNAIAARRAAGKRPRVAIFDVISSLPGIRMPFEKLTALCKEEGLVSLVDGAHGIGNIHIDLAAVDPDFFVSNCHKWLFVPRGCAVFYVPLRNQPLIRSTLPTSHGFIPRAVEAVSRNPLPPSVKSEFVNNFEFVGTIDNAPYLCIPEALKFRKEVCGGEDKIIEYNLDLARRGGARVAEILGTDVLDNESHTMSACTMTNIRLPFHISDEEKPGVTTISPQEVGSLGTWLQNTLMDEYDTFIPMYPLQGKLWTRLSAQVYLDIEDFEWAGYRLKEICERAAQGEFKVAKKAIVIR